MAVNPFQISLNPSLSKALYFQSQRTLPCKMHRRVPHLHSENPLKQKRQRSQCKVAQSLLRPNTTNRDGADAVMSCRIHLPIPFIPRRHRLWGIFFRRQLSATFILRLHHLLTP